RRRGVALKMVFDTTDHQISPRVKETHHFNTILQKCCPTTVEWLKARILSPVYAVCWIINQVHFWIRSGACRLGREKNVNVLRLSPTIIHNGLVEPADHKVHSTACLNGRVVWHQYVVVSVAIGRIIRGKSIERGLRLPCAEANGDIRRRLVQR